MFKNKTVKPVVIKDLVSIPSSTGLSSVYIVYSIPANKIQTFCKNLFKSKKLYVSCF